MDTARAAGHWAEDQLAGVTPIVRPYLPVAARLLLVLTFVEDALRILSQWNVQASFMQYSRGLPALVAGAFLAANVVLQLACSALVLVRIRVDVAVGGLIFVLFLQAVGYGLLTDVGFIFRALSVCGGLLMLLIDYWNSTNKKSTFPGLPELDRGERAAYLQMAGRVLLVGLVLSLLFGGELSAARLAIGAVGAAMCIFVIIGFKAKSTALLLMVVLSVLNVVLNGWWFHSVLDTERDFLRYDFFQTLSVVGGFLLLVNLGPGGLSVDEKKKRY